MTKREYRKEILNKIITELDKHIEEANRKQKYARNTFDKGKWAGTRQEAEKIRKWLGGTKE